jgi:hypothetical protein
MVNLVKLLFSILFILNFCIGKINGQYLSNVIKINSEINTLFEGKGLIFSKIGYERFLNKKNSVGFWLGGKLHTSKLELDNKITVSSINSYVFVLDYYYYLHKYNNNGIYISPSVFYENTFLNIDDDHLDIYGLGMSIGYRHTFNRIIIDCALFSTFEYSKQKNNIYIYQSKEIKPIDIKISVCYGF